MQDAQGIDTQNSGIIVDDGLSENVNEPDDCFETISEHVLCTRQQHIIQSNPQVDDRKQGGPSKGTHGGMLKKPKQRKTRKHNQKKKKKTIRKNKQHTKRSKRTFKKKSHKKSNKSQ